MDWICNDERVKYKDKRVNCRTRGYEGTTSSESWKRFQGPKIT